MKGVNINRKSYPSDLTDAQCKKLSSFLPTPQLGRPLKWEKSSTPSFMSSSQGASGECYPMICHRGKLSITISESGKPTIHGS